MVRNRKMRRPVMAWKVVVILLFAPIWAGCGLREARVKREKDATAHYKFGLAYLGDTPPQLQQAFIEFQKAAKLDPRNRDAYYALGHVFFQQERYSKAISSFKKALLIDPEHSESHNYLGRIYSFQGEFDKALASYKAALKNPKYRTPEKPYWNMGLLYDRQEKYHEAVIELKNALRVNPNIVAVHNLLGEVYSKMGEMDQAIASYKEAIRITPKDINAHYNLACIYQQQGADQLANTAFNQVISLSPVLAQEEDFKKCLNPSR